MIPFRGHELRVDDEQDVVVEGYHDVLIASSLVIIVVVNVILNFGSDG